MKASELINKLYDIANNYKTLYVMGCFGAPMTASNKKRYTNNHDYNRKAERTKMINAASADTFGFDCCNLIKGILWGWSGSASKVYGGATYASNGVPDLSADGMIQKCKNVTTDFSNIIPGEAVWCKGHIGVYVGDGLAIECTPAWKNRVQITAVRNIQAKDGYNNRTWTKHGIMPWVEYDVKTTTIPKSTSVATTKLDCAKSFDKAISGTYKTAADLNLRSGAGTSKPSLIVMPKGTSVRNYGYYTEVSGTKWYYVALILHGKTYQGFCSSKYLKK